MKITGIICEYNPFHIGHAKQIAAIRAKEPDSAIVCLMSGNYVQRGMPAVFDKAVRAKAAILCGADLVLELPVTAALSSAEGFAFQGVQILSGFCDTLSFGAETADADLLLDTARVLLTEDFSDQLKKFLILGVSFPAARQKALESMGLDAAALTKPNNILAVEYCKAILSQNSQMKPEPIHRMGDYHDSAPDLENPSASSLRLMIENRDNWHPFVPNSLVSLFENAPVHTLHAGEKAILYRLRTMTDEEFEALPYGSEGLWRKLMKNARTCGSLEQILTATKSKRYTRTRLDRMVMCAYLGLSAKKLASPAPYCRVLALNDTGRTVLSKARESGVFPNLGEKLEHPYQVIENHSDDLYRLFQTSTEECLSRQTLYYHSN